MTRSCLIEALESRELFSVTSALAPQQGAGTPPAPSIQLRPHVDTGPVRLMVSTSPIDAQFSSQTGDGQILGNL